MKRRTALCAAPAAAQHGRGRHEAHEDDVHDQADEQIGEVELELVPELVTPLAHLRKRRAARVYRDLRAHLEQEAVVVDEAVAEPGHVGEQAREEALFEGEPARDRGALDALGRGEREKVSRQLAARRAGEGRGLRGRQQRLRAECCGGMCAAWGSAGMRVGLPCGQPRGGFVYCQAGRCRCTRWEQSGDLRCGVRQHATPVWSSTHLRQREA